MSPDNIIRSSMLWAAYGDALGFITELCDERTLSYRTGGQTRITSLIPWKRKIGGEYGVSWPLPKGCYSDDTQLRLAVCRSIREDGVFDVEPFAKVELPIFTSYALGAGTSTKSAAESLRKKNTNWNTNFYQTPRSRYIDAGGNGGAMRIQPHVWSAKKHAAESDLLRDIIRDTIVTHGHATAIVGAVFHALMLRRVLINRSSVPAHEWQAIVEQAEKIPEIVHADEELSVLWLPEWERLSEMSFESAVRKSATELMADVRKATDLLSSSRKTKDRAPLYAEILSAIGALDRTRFGSATKTALLAACIGEVFAENPQDGLVACVNVLHSDTDTIATMAGALMGATGLSDPPDRVMDTEYLEQEASRLSAISDGRETKRHQYPDLLSWNPPLSNLDAIASDGTKLLLRGFGEVSGGGQSIEQKGKFACVWQEVKTSFGQTLVVKRRKSPKKIGEDDLPVSAASQVVSPKSAERKAASGTMGGSQLELPGHKSLPKTQQAPLTVDRAADLAINSGFDEGVIGHFLVGLAEQQDGLEKAIGFAAIIAKAKRYRMKKSI